MQRFLSLKRYLSTYWQQGIIFFVATGTLVGVLVFKLNTLVPGASTSEVFTDLQVSSFKQVIMHPTFMPYNLVKLAFDNMGSTSLFANRLVSVLFGLVVVFGFYYTLSHWYSRRIANLSTLAFVCSSWFLHAARLATPDIMFATFVLIPAYGTWLQLRKQPHMQLLAAAALALLLIYTPGGIWLLFVGVAWQLRTIIRFVRQVPFTTGAAAVIFVLGLIPLGIAIINNLQDLRGLIGLPEKFPSVITIQRNLADVPLTLGWRSPVDPTLRLANLPLLDIFVGFMAILGIFYYIQRLRLQRSIFLLGMFILGSGLVPLHGLVSIVILLPVVYLLMAGGMSYLLGDWFTVFPRNPVARNIATTLITSAVLLSCFYHINRYFIAWPHAPKTVKAFQKISAK